MIDMETGIDKETKTR